MIQNCIALSKTLDQRPNYEIEYFGSIYGPNCIRFETPAQPDALTKVISYARVMIRLISALITRLALFTSVFCGRLDSADWLAARFANLLSSVTFPKKVYE